MSNKLSVSSLLLLLLFLVEVHSQQTFPYVSFGSMGPALANNSYVDLSLVGSAGDNRDSVVCHTDLSTCCSGGQGIHRGNWSFPDGTVLPFTGNSVPIGLGRGARVAIIRRTNDATEPTGIYRCDIFQLMLSIVILINLWEKQSMWDCIQLMEVNSNTDTDCRYQSPHSMKHTSKLHSTFTTAL